MKRAIVLVGLVAFVAGCASDHTAAAPTTTAAPTTPPSTTTAPPTTLPAGQAFHTNVPGVLTVGTESLEPPWYVGGG